MKEIWELSLNPWILPFTVLLGVCVLYWLLSIVGFVDLDLDADADAGTNNGSLTDGVLGSLLRFMNASEVPLMVVLTMMFLALWAFGIFGHATFNQDNTTWIAGVILAGSFVLSVLMVKLLTLPLRPLFKVMRKGENDGEPVYGREATVVSLSLDERGGQVEVARENGAPALLNCRLVSGGPLSRGEKVVLFDQEESTGTYLARPI